MNALPVSRAYDLGVEANGAEWLIDDLWAEQAVGILGGEPKCCKSFLALDIAVSVASGTPCLRRFPARRTGPVLIFPAEDALGVVRQRLDGICRAAETDLAALPLYVITAPRVLLDLPQDRQCLRRTVAELKPVLLVLDPFIRLHRADENASREVAPLLGYLRELQREFHIAVILVHHVRKRSGKDRPGQALRGSSDLHGWGDSNLYLRRNGAHLILSVEHRAAPPIGDIALALRAEGSATALGAVDSCAESAAAATPTALSVAERIVQVIAEANGPLSVQDIRKRSRMRTATVCDTLAVLRDQGRIFYGTQGYTLSGPAVSVSRLSIGAAGKGNGKHPDNPAGCSRPLPLFSGETQAGSAGTQPAQG